METLDETVLFADCTSRHSGIQPQARLESAEQTAVVVNVRGSTPVRVEQNALGLMGQGRPMKKALFPKVMLADILKKIFKNLVFVLCRKKKMVH